MRRLVLLFALAASAAGTIPASSEAGPPARFPFRNATPYPIIVVMDTDREVHHVPPGGGAVFVRANVGDTPTFRVYQALENGQRGGCLGGEAFGTMRISGFPPLPRLGGRDLTWDGRLHD